MKGSITTVRTIMVLSLALMLFFRYEHPEHPPSAYEVNLWVGVVAVLVTSTKALWSRLRAFGTSG